MSQGFCQAKGPPTITFRGTASRLKGLSSKGKVPTNVYRQPSPDRFPSARVRRASGTASIAPRVCQLPTKGTPASRQGYASIPPRLPPASGAAGPGSCQGFPPAGDAAESTVNYKVRLVFWGSWLFVSCVI
jgi:hypothetical protein